MELPEHGQASGRFQELGPTVVVSHDLKPHQTRTFKLSNDRQFEQKFWDIVGLYSVASAAGRGAVL